MSSRRRVVISEEALRAAERVARRNPHREVGGILLGFRLDEAVHVEDLIPVPDPMSTPTRFVLRATQREAALGSYRQSLPMGSPIGYVGTWHSHLGDLGPSWMDRRTFRHEVWSAGDVLALVVLAMTADGWRPVALTGRPRLRVGRAEVEVV